MSRDHLSPRFSVSSSGSSVQGPASRAESNGRMGPHHPFAPVTSRRELLAARLGQHRNSPIKQIRAQTSMLLILGFAESSNDSESIFRSRDGKAPGRKRKLLAPRG